ncbi:MAG: metallophosphoesterase family protein [Anaerolineae bacterium]|nr:metallophosphoesterase family protein [Anaerolineae bacterium]
MKLGLIADIHADAPTLRRALSLLDALGAAQVLCAGDLVDYGCCPDETINLLRARDIPCVCGNHDREAFTRKPSRHKPYHTDPARLAPESRAYLRALPFDYKARFNGRCVALYHAAPTTDLELVHPEVMPGGALDALFDEASADVLVLGHTHIPSTSRRRAASSSTPARCWRATRRACPARARSACSISRPWTTSCSMSNRACRMPRPVGAGSLQNGHCGGHCAAHLGAIEARPCFGERDEEPVLLGGAVRHVLDHAVDAAPLRDLHPTCFFS